MNIEFTDEQIALRASVRGVLTDTAKSDADERWDGLMALGLAEIPFPENVGGAGSTVKNTGIVVAELGRVLDPGPYLSSIGLAGLTLLYTLPQHGGQLLEGICTGQVVAALIDPLSCAHPQTIKLRERSGSGVELTGEALTIGATRTDVFVVVVRDDARDLIVMVDADSDGLSIAWLDSLDLRRPCARVGFDGAIGTVLGEATSASLKKARAAGRTLRAAEQIGGAERCLEMAVDYAKTRTQFGRTIGSFQAVKHKIVDVHLLCELAWASVLVALDAQDDHFATADVLHACSHEAAALASQALSVAAAESIQVHGGIGFTWEHELHHFFRRAYTVAQLAGSVGYHYDAIANSALGSIT